MSVQLIAAKLSNLRNRLRRLILAVGLLRVVLTSAGIAALMFFADWHGRFSAGTRITMLVAGAAVLIAAIWQWIVRPMRIRLSDDALALLVERQYPAFADSLISAVQLGRSSDVPTDAHFNSPRLVQQIVQLASEQADTTDFGGVLRTRSFKKLLAAFAVVAILFGIFATAHAELVRIWSARMFTPYAGVEWPRKTTIVLPGREKLTYLAKGDEFTVDASVSGSIPGRLTMNYRFATGTPQIRRMTHIADGDFRAYFASVNEDFTFSVSGGDHATEQYRVVVIERPRVETITITYDFPEYTGLAGYEQTPGQGDVTGVVGTTVSITAQTNKRVRSDSASIVFDNGESIPLKVTSDTVAPQQQPIPPEQGRGSVLTGEFVLEPGPTSYRIEIIDLDGLPDTSPVTYRLRAIVDNAPTVRVVRPRGNREVTAAATIEVVVISTDEPNYGGIRETRFVMQKGDDEPLFREAFTDTQPGQARIENRGAWELKTAALREGEMIRCWVEAEDYNDVTGPGIGRSEPFYLTIVSPAQLASRLDDQLEQVKNDVAAILKVEEQLKQQTDQLMNKLQREEELSGDDLKNLAGAIERQKSLANQANMAADKLDAIASEMASNQIGTDHDIERLQSQSKTLSDIAEKSMPKAAMALAKAQDDPDVPKLRDASNQQAAIINQLDALLRQLTSTEDIDELIRQATRLVLRQENINERTLAVSGRTLGQTADEMSEDDRALLRALQRDQAGANEEMRNIESAMSKFVQENAQRSPLAAAAVQEAFEQASEERIRQTMHDISEILGRLTSAPAIQMQENVYAGLQRLLANLQEAKRHQRADTEQLRDEMEQAQRDLQEIIDRQRELREAADADRAAAIAQAQQRLNDAITRQQELQAETQAAAEAGEDTAGLAQEQQELQREVADLANALEELGDSASDAAAETSRAAEAMQQAQEGLAADQPQAAEAAQQAATEALQAAAEALEQLAAESDPGRIAEEQERLAEDTAELAERMEELAEQARSVDPALADRLEQAANSAQQAQQDMQQAAESFGQGDTEAGTEQQDNALDNLEEAQRQQEQASQELDNAEREQELFEISQALEDLYTRQQIVNAETIAIDNHVIQEGELSRRMLLQLRETAARQAGLQEDAQDVLERLENANSAVFAFAMEGVVNDMQEAAEQLDEQHTGWSTQQIQREIERTLMELLKAFQEEYEQARAENDGEQQPDAGGDGGGGGSEPPPLVPPLAELKMLRTLQANILQSTQALNEAKVLERMSPVLLQRRIERLGERQEQVSRIATQLADGVE